MDFKNVSQEIKNPGNINSNSEDEWDENLSI